MEEPLLKPAEEYGILKDLLPRYKQEFISFGLKATMAKRRFNHLNLDPEANPDEKGLTLMAVNKAKAERDLTKMMVEDIRTRMAELYEQLTEDERKEFSQ